MNQTTQRESGVSEQNQNTLAVISLAALAPLTDAIFALALDPKKSLGDLREYLHALRKRGRDDECFEMLCLVYAMLGIEFADTLALLRGHDEEQGIFLDEFSADIEELIDELSEKPIAN